MPSPWTVPLEPILVAACAVLAGGTAVASRLTAGSWSRRRVLAIVGATGLLAVCWVSPLQTLAAHYLLSAHLLQVTLLMGVVPPLLLLGLPQHSELRMPRGLRGVTRALVHPLAGMIAVNAAFFGLHVPVAYNPSLHSSPLYAGQQLTLLLASVMFWWPIVVPLGGRRVISRWGTLGYILVATIPQTMAGITVALVKHPMYDYASTPRLFNLSAMTDQQIAGACTALVSKIALFTAFSIVFMRMLSDTTQDGPDDGGGGGGRRPTTETPSPQPSGSVPWLADINSGRTVPEPVPRRLRVPAAPGSRRG